MDIITLAISSFLHVLYIQYIFKIENLAKLFYNYSIWKSLPRAKEWIGLMVGTDE